MANVNDIYVPVKTADASVSVETADIASGLAILTLNLPEGFKATGKVENADGINVDVENGKLTWTTGTVQPGAYTVTISDASLVVGIIVMAALLIFMKPVLTLFGADAQTYDFARGYVLHISYGAPFVIWSAAASFIVRAEGSSKEAMIGSMIGTVSNIVLDPVFISGFGMGAAGAAIATTIGNILASLYFVWYFLKKSTYFSIIPKDFKISDGVMSRICATGFPTAIFSVLMSVSTIVLNQILVAYGNAPVAAFGVVFKANMFITFLQLGLANGVQPLLGYNYGSGDTKRFHAVEMFTKKCCVIVGALSTLLFFILRTQIITMFINDSDVIYYGVKMLTAYMLSGPVIGILFVNMNCMQSTNRALPATILSILRQGALLIPLFFILNLAFGINGVFFAQAVTDYVAIILSVIIWMRAKKQMAVKKEI